MKLNELKKLKEFTERLNIQTLGELQDFQQKNKQGNETLIETLQRVISEVK